MTENYFIFSFDIKSLEEIEQKLKKNINDFKIVFFGDNTIEPRYFFLTIFEKINDIYFLLDIPYYIEKINENIDFKTFCLNFEKRSVFITGFFEKPNLSFFQDYINNFFKILYISTLIYHDANVIFIVLETEEIRQKIINLFKKFNHKNFDTIHYRINPFCDKRLIQKNFKSGLILISNINIPNELTEFYDFYSQFGNILNYNLSMNLKGNVCLFILFENYNSALNLKNTLNNKNIFLFPELNSYDILSSFSSSPLKLEKIIVFETKKPDWILRKEINDNFGQISQIYFKINSNNNKKFVFLEFIDILNLNLFINNLIENNQKFYIIGQRIYERALNITLTINISPNYSNRLFYIGPNQQLTNYEDQIKLENFLLNSEFVDGFFYPFNSHHNLIVLFKYSELKFELPPNIKYFRYRPKLTPSLNESNKIIQRSQSANIPHFQ